MKKLPFILYLVFSSAFAQTDQKKKDLERFEIKIREHRERLKKTLQKEGSLHSELQRISQSVDRLDQELKGLTQERTDLEKKIRNTEREISEQQKSISWSQEDVSRHIRNQYKYGTVSPLKWVLVSSSPSETRRVQHYAQTWIQYDVKTINDYQKSVNQLTKYKSILESHRADKVRLVDKLEGKSADLGQEKSDRKELLALVQNQREFYEKSLQELEQNAKNLQKFIEKKMREAQSEESEFARLKGRLIWPVLGGVLKKRFGPYIDAKVNTKLYHKGMDIQAPEGSPIRAAFDGKVVYADWFEGYGKIIIVDHGSYYFTLYSHANELLKKMDDPVSAGETIAYVGDTGSLKGPYLYFELRNKAVSLDPEPWFPKHWK